MSDELEPYDRIIEVFNSVNLPAKQREAILTWHHALIDKRCNEARIDELEKINLNLVKTSPDWRGTKTIYNYITKHLGELKANQEKSGEVR